MRPSRPFLRPAILTFAGLLLPGASTLRAQDPVDPLPRFDQQVFVTASRFESTVARVPAFVTLIDEDEIETSPAQDIPELLRQAGLLVTDQTGARRSFQVDLGGFGATATLNTLVLVDGRRINQPDLSGSDWTLIPLHRVARIEIIRTSGAVAFGDNATGGVINIITKNEGPAETRVGVTVGGFGTITPEVSTRGARGQATYALTGRVRRSDGHRQNAQSDGVDAGGQTTVRFNPRVDVTVTGGYHGDRTGLPGALTESDLAGGVARSDSLTPDDYADVDDGYVMATPRAMLGSRGQAAIDVSVRQRDSRFFSSFSGGQFTGDTGIRTVAAAPRVTLGARTGRIEHVFVAGGDFSTASENIRNTTIFGGAASEGVFTLEKASRAVYLRDEVLAGRVSITGGYRFDTAEYRFDPGTPASRFLDAHAADVGATMIVGGPASAFASVSRSFRHPVLDELFDFFTNSIDTGLVPQRSIGLEGGLRLELGATRATIAVFRATTRDEIFFNPAGGAFGFGANENLEGDSRRSGVNLSLQGMVRRVRLGGTLSLLATSIEGGAYDGESAPGVPGRRASLEAVIPMGQRLTLAVDGTYTGVRRFEGDFAGTYGDQDAFFLVDVRFAWRMGPARLRFDLKNLFDAEYSEFGVIGGFPAGRAFYPSPGIHVMAGVDVAF